MTASQRPSPTNGVNRPALEREARWLQWMDGDKAGPVEDYIQQARKNLDQRQPISCRGSIPSRTQAH